MGSSYNFRLSVPVYHDGFRNFRVERSFFFFQSSDNNTVAKLELEFLLCYNHLSTRY